MSPSQSATSQWRWGSHTVRGGIDPGGLRFRHPVVGVVEIWKDFESGDETLSPRVRRDLDVVPWGNFRGALAP